MDENGLEVYENFGEELISKDGIDINKMKKRFFNEISNGVMNKEYSAWREQFPTVFEWYCNKYEQMRDKGIIVSNVSLIIEEVVSEYNSSKGKDDPKITSARTLSGYIARELALRYNELITLWGYKPLSVSRKKAPKILPKEDYEKMSKDKLVTIVQDIKYFIEEYRNIEAVIESIIRTKKYD